METKRPRRPNFSASETDALIDAVEPNLSALNAKFGLNSTSCSKLKIWEQIARKVNSTSSCIRTVKELKKKWADMQSGVRKRETQKKQSLGKTGGGPAPKPLTALEEKVLPLICPVMIDGISDGLETDVGGIENNSVTAKGDNNDNGGIANQMGLAVERSDNLEYIRQLRREIEEPNTCTVSAATPSKKRVVEVPKRKCPKLPSKFPSSDILEIEKEKLKLKKRKVEILEKMLKMEEEKTAIFRQFYSNQSSVEESSLMLSPVIQFL